MRILSLDFDPVFGSNANRSSFAADESAFDYDLVIWDPEGSFDSYLRHANTYQGLPALSDTMSSRITGDAARRGSEFVDFVNSGRTLVVIARPPQECFVATGNVDYSGTGRNRAATRIVRKFDLLSALPIGGTEFVRAGGTRITVEGDDALALLLRKYLADFRYEATLEPPPGRALARVTGTERTIASIERSAGGGHLVFLPTIDLERPPDEDDDPEDDEPLYRDDAPTFQSDLVAAIQNLSGVAELARPSWAASYLTQEQRRLGGEVDKQQARVETARARLATLKQQRQAAEARDQLFLGTGRALELEVRAVLEALGGQVTDPEPGRDDWKVAFPEGTAVVEVKGVTKSAAERHAAQLEKWIATELENTGASPKGILVVNTWREKPLADRTEADFPEQMLAYSTSRSHCLVTGLQLFTMLADIESDPARKEHWRKEILACSGQLKGTPDWQTVIEVTQHTDQAEGG